MKKTSILLCVIGAYLASPGVETSQIHVQNIRHAISQLRNTISNEIATAYYDFAAILGEIKTVQPDAERLQLMEELVAPLFDAQDGQWQREGHIKMTREKNYLLRIALETLIGDQYIAFKWNCHLKRLQSMKKELSFYADAPNPDAVRAALWPKQKEEFKREYEKLRTQSKEKVIIISRTYPPSKEWSDAADRWGYKKWIESSIRSYEKDNFDALKFKIDYNHMPANEKQQLMEKVRKELGRYPKWHKAEKDATEKDG